MALPLGGGCGGEAGGAIEETAIEVLGGGGGAGGGVSTMVTPAGGAGAEGGAAAGIVLNGVVQVLVGGRRGERRHLGECSQGVEELLRAAHFQACIGRVLRILGGPR